MKLITSNEQLCAILPNIQSVVKGERSLFFKIVPFIDAAEIWLIDNIVSQTVFELISDRPQDDEAKLAMTRIVALDAFRNAIPHLDLILTPNGFGIVSNTNVAPASKDRVERLISSLLANLDDEIEEQRAKCQTCLSISESDEILRSESDVKFGSVFFFFVI